ncbi:hypothetical protein EH223_20495 [candidate division KSB1 bacterium]|nr:tetratricopeptide repeat protein [candidate division KSB1 bacterium]RQV99883.1 MAG: hypothetical protein EH223_20495 [candidate division KSB1 bacterium]
MQSYASEIEWLKSKVSENPASMLYARLADRHLKINEIDRATEYAEKSVLLHPHDATSRYVLAKCYYANTDYENAGKHLHEALLAEPNHLAALFLQGDLFRSSGDRARVEENYNRIIDLDPFDDTIHQEIYNLKHELSPLEETAEEESRAFEPESREPGFSDTEPEPLDRATTDEYDVDLDQQDREISYDEDPFADFEETPAARSEEFWSGTESTFDETEKTTAANEEYADQLDLGEKEQIEEEQQAFEYREDGETKTGDTSESEYRGEEVLDESLDDNFEIDRSKFKEEESKFTKLLDDIFSSSLEEEEQAENKRRTTLEKMEEDKVEQPEDESAKVFEPLLPRDEDLTPEEKILQNDRKQYDDSFNYRDDIDSMLDESDISEEIVAPDEENNGREDQNDIDEPAAKPRSTGNDFAHFLNSLDIKDDSKEAEKKLDQFDDSFVGLEDDFSLPEDLEDTLPPLSIDDDWMQSKSEKPAGFNEKKESESNKGKFFTPTLGEIYAAQGQYAKAISVFETLIKNDPENDWYLSKLEYLKKKLAEQKR